MLSLEQLAGLLDSHRQAGAANVRDFSIGRRLIVFNSAGAIIMMKGRELVAELPAVLY